MSGMLEGKKIIVAGCSSGNGFGIVQRMIEEGADIVGFSRSMREEDIRDVKRRGPGKFTWLGLDARDRDACRQRIDEAAELLGGIDALVCCLYTYWEKECENLTREDFDAMFETGFYGYVNLNQLAFPYLKKSRGTIINFGSGAGVTTKLVGADPAHYSAAKGAVHMWTRTIASEWGKYGINANILAPMVWTAHIDDAITTPEAMEAFSARIRDRLTLGDMYLSKATPYELVAPTVAFLCSDNARYITGQMINVDGGMVESR